MSLDISDTDKIFTQISPFVPASKKQQFEHSFSPHSIVQVSPTEVSIMQPALPLIPNSLAPYHGPKPISYALSKPIDIVTPRIQQQRKKYEQLAALSLVPNIDFDDQIILENKLAKYKNLVFLRTMANNYPTLYNISSNS